MFPKFRAVCGRDEAVVIAFTFPPFDVPRWISSSEGRLILIGGGAVLVALVVYGLLRLLSRSGRTLAADAPLQPAPHRMPEYDPFCQGSLSEQRGAWRRKGNPVGVLIRRAGSHNEPMRGWVCDRAVGGLGLAVNCQFKEGERLSVLPASSSDVAPWVDVEVRSIVARGKNEWLIGCQFLTPMQWSVLLLFG